MHNLGYSVNVTDFDKKQNQYKKHPEILDWVMRYFDPEQSILIGEKQQNSADYPCKFYETDLSPLYFQFQGHSQTIGRYFYYKSWCGVHFDQWFDQ